MTSTRTQRLLGLGLLLAGTAATWWHARAIDLDSIDGEQMLEAAFLFPFTAGTGLLLLLQPISRRTLLERFGVDRPHRFGHYSWPQRLLFLLAVGAGLVNVGRVLIAR